MPHSTKAATSAAGVVAPDIRRKARAWYDRQLTICAEKHGASWPAHREWVEDYLKEELRQKLQKQGWRAKDGQTHC